ncbi:helix-turn-helix domain-containing protein [Paraburkholderia sp. A1RI-2L]|uniref:helix-turn-helix domain-containing protein n=1 Tax=Paraburkholderia sp. A1RI-2L TaxID=3028367 RepID=UPI003B7B514B
MTVKHLNQRDLAERWDISEATLERWRSDGIGPVFMKLQGRVLYRLEDVEAYETESLRRSTSEPFEGKATAAVHASMNQ